MSDDRQWQHPAERGAEHGHDLIVNPPPLGRRIAMMTAVVSIIASLAVMTVAIPKGISEYADEPDVSTTTTISPRVKNAVGSAMTTVVSGDTPSSALPLGGGYWLTASDQVDSDQKLSLRKAGSSPMAARIVAAMGKTGTILVMVPKSESLTRPIDFDAIVDPDRLGDLSRYWVFDPSSGQMSRLEPSIALAKGTDDVPVNTREPIGGVASLLDHSGTTVGIVVRRGHSTWLLGRNSVDQLMKYLASR